MIEVSVIRGAGVKARMGTFVVVKLQTPANRSARLCDAVVSPKIDFLVFDRAPETLDKDVVVLCILAIYI